MQATSLAHVGNLLKRVRSRPELPLLLRGGRLVEVWGWDKRGCCGCSKRVAIAAEDLAGVVVEGLPGRRRSRGERQREFCLEEGEP
jgi:hypothetical protein